MKGYVEDVNGHVAKKDRRMNKPWKMSNAVDHRGNTGRNRHGTVPLCTYQNRWSFIINPKQPWQLGFGKNSKEQELLHIAERNTKCQTLGNSLAVSYSVEQKMLTIWPRLKHLGVFTLEKRKLMFTPKSCVHVLMNLVIIKSWKQPRCLPTEDCLN